MADYRHIKVTWADFKRMAQEAGVDDNDQLSWIDWNTPYSVEMERNSNGSIIIKQGDHLPELEEEETLCLCGQPYGDTRYECEHCGSIMCKRCHELGMCWDCPFGSKPDSDDKPHREVWLMVSNPEEVTYG